ncbi:MAG TPA: hypothetical protein VGM56_04055 [Byssovorax sp.]
MRAPLDGQAVLTVALAASIALHVVLPLSIHALRSGRREAPVTAVDAVADEWTGQTSALGGELVEVEPADLAASKGAAPAAPAAPVEASKGEPAAREPAAPEPPVAERPKLEAPKPEAKPAPKVHPPPAAAPKPIADADADPYADAKPPEPAESAAAAPRASTSKRASRAAKPSTMRQDKGAGDGDGSAPGVFGSEGKPGVRSVGRAFTRAIPIGAQANPIWSTLAPGSTLKAELTLRIDASGRIEGHAFEGREPPPAALVALAKGTIASIDGGTFALRSGAVAHGTERLRLVATIADGGAGARDELDFVQFDGVNGEAAFTQSGGRRVSVSVTVVRVEVLAE